MHRRDRRAVAGRQDGDVPAEDAATGGGTGREGGRLRRRDGGRAARRPETAAGGHCVPRPRTRPATAVLRKMIRGPPGRGQHREGDRRGQRRTAPATTEEDAHPVAHRDLAGEEPAGRGAAGRSRTPPRPGRRRPVAATARRIAGDVASADALRHPSLEGVEQRLDARLRQALHPVAGREGRQRPGRDRGQDARRHRRITAKTDVAGRRGALLAETRRTASTHTVRSQRDHAQAGRSSQPIVATCPARNRTGYQIGSPGEQHDASARPAARPGAARSRTGRRAPAGRCRRRTSSADSPRWRRRRGQAASSPYPAGASRAPPAPSRPEAGPRPTSSRDRMLTHSSRPRSHRRERHDPGGPAEPPPVLQDGGQRRPAERLADGHGGPALGAADGG